MFSNQNLNFNKSNYVSAGLNITVKSWARACVSCAGDGIFKRQENYHEKNKDTWNN